MAGRDPAPPGEPEPVGGQARHPRDRLGQREQPALTHVAPEHARERPEQARMRPPADARRQSVGADHRLWMGEHRLDVCLAHREADHRYPQPLLAEHVDERVERISPDLLGEPWQGHALVRVARGARDDDRVPHDALVGGELRARPRQRASIAESLEHRIGATVLEPRRQHGGEHRRGRPRMDRRPGRRTGPSAARGVQPLERRARRGPTTRDRPPSGGRSGCGSRLARRSRSPPRCSSAAAAPRRAYASRRRDRRAAGERAR